MKIGCSFSYSWNNKKQTPAFCPVAHVSHQNQIRQRKNRRLIQTTQAADPQCHLVLSLRQSAFPSLAQPIDRLHPEVFCWGFTAWSAGGVAYGAPHPKVGKQKLKLCLAMDFGGELQRDCVMCVSRRVGGLDVRLFSQKESQDGGVRQHRYKLPNVHFNALLHWIRTCIFVILWYCDGTSIFHLARSDKGILTHQSRINFGATYFYVLLQICCTVCIYFLSLR